MCIDTVVTVQPFYPDYMFLFHRTAVYEIIHNKKYKKLKYFFEICHFIVRFYEVSSATYLKLIFISVSLGIKQPFI